MITSTSGCSSSSRTAALTRSTALTPCTGTLRTSKRTAGQRRRAFSSTSRSAAEPRPVTSPTHCGRNGSGFLRSAANRPSPASRRFSCSSRARSSPSPTGRISEARIDSCPRAAYHSGLACTTTRAPSCTTSATWSNTERKQVTVSDTSA